MKKRCWAVWQSRTRSNSNPTKSVEAFLRRLSAARVNLTNVIDVSFNWDDPFRSAEIANAVGKAYITDQLNAKFEANRTATLWLQQRIQQLGDQAETAERAVNAYKTQHNIVSSEGKSVDEQQISGPKWPTCRGARPNSGSSSAPQSLRKRLEAGACGPAVDRDAGFGRIGRVDQPDHNHAAPAISRAGQTRKRVFCALRRGPSERGEPSHAIAGVALLHFRRGSSPRRDHPKRIQRCQQREQGLEKQLADTVAQSRATNSAEVTLRELESKAKNYRTLYGTFLQRYMGSAQQETFPISEARVIYPAFPPDTKSKPKTILILALALFGGIGLGGGLGLVREMMDRVFRTPGQVEAALGLPCLAVVPMLQAATRTSKAAEPGPSGANSPNDQEPPGSSRPLRHRTGASSTCHCLGLRSRSVRSS